MRCEASHVSLGMMASCAPDVIQPLPGRAQVEVLHEVLEASGDALQVEVIDGCCVVGGLR